MTSRRTLSSDGAVGPRGQMFGSRRRRVRTPVVVALVALAIAPAGWSVLTSEPSARASAPRSAPHTAAMDAAGVAPAEVGTPAVELPRVFATYEGMELRLPDDDLVLVGYHEASLADALALVPVGDSLANDNRTKYEVREETAAGPGFVVLSSRGRPNPATSAVDLVMRDDVPVLSPVTGRVVDARPYSLYGKYPDHRIEIVPEERPDLRVVLIHLRDVEVSVGDRVEAGVTPLAASANRFPFSSHIDVFTEPDRWPHVHVELKRG